MTWADRSDLGMPDSPTADFGVHLVRVDDRAEEIALKLEPLIDAVFAPPIRNYRARIKHALVLQSVLHDERVRQPLLPLSQAEQAAVRHGLVHAGLLEDKDT